MKIRIKFTISEGGRFGNSSGKVVRDDNSINIELDTLDGVRIQDETDGRNITTIKDASTIYKIERIKKLKITFSNAIEAKKVYGLLHLKHKLKGSEPWDFIINHVNFNEEMLDYNDTTNTLNLFLIEFDNDLDNIDISKLLDGGFPAFAGDFKNNRKELYELEDLLVELEGHYFSPNASLQNSVNDLNKLETYSKSGPVKQDLFDLRDSPGDTSNIIGFGKGDPHIFRTRINSLAKALEEFAVWKQIGFTRLDQILKANANGFTIAQRGGMKGYVTIGKKDPSGKLIYEIGDENLSLGTSNVNAITAILAGGKYRGLPIIDPDQPGAKKGEGAQRHLTLFDYSCQEGKKEYTKTHIDRFRVFLEKNMGSDGGEATEKRKCFGFEITDISGRGYYQDRPGCKAEAGKTKISYDIWAAPNLEAAIDLAFFGNPYPGMKNVDDSLLFLNEVEGKSRKEILDIYLNEGLKSEMCGRGNYLAIAHNWYDSSYDASEISRKKIDEIIYPIIERWATILDNYESGKYTAGATYDKDKAKNDKDNLEKIKNAAKSDANSYEGKLVSKWESKIDEVIEGLEIFLGKRPPSDKLPPEVISKIEGYLVSETDDTVQKVWEESKKMKATDNITVQTVEKLKELVDLLKNFGQSSSVDTLIKLKHFSSAQPSSEEGKAWTIAKKVLDTNGKVWAEEILKKCQITALTDAQSKLKAAVGSENIFQQIAKSIEKDAIAINQASEIFNWAKQSLGIEGTDETQEVKDLKSKLQTAQNHTSAWNAVNHYKENSSDTEGYATKAYKKIQSFSKNRQEVVDKSRLAEAKSREELDQFYQQMKEGQNFTGSLKETVEKKSYPRAKIVASIREKKDNVKPEERALIELIKDFVTKAEIDTDFGNDLNKTDYRTLKDKQESLVKYTETGTAENNVFENLPPEQKQTITELLSELSSKVEKMKNSIEQEDSGNRSDPNISKEPFYKTAFGITIISIVIVLVLSLAFWFFVKKRKKWQEE